METTTKSPVEIVQEQLAIHATRKEAAERLKQTHAARQSEEAIAEWMEELSNYGDAVTANADRENEYQQAYTNALGTIDALSPQEREQTFQSLEESLKRIYQNTLTANTDLPASITEILNKQLSKLTKA